MSSPVTARKKSPSSHSVGSHWRYHHRRDSEVCREIDKPLVVAATRPENLGSVSEALVPLFRDIDDLFLRADKQQNSRAKHRPRSLKPCKNSRRQQLRADSTVCAVERQQHNGPVELQKEEFGLATASYSNLVTNSSPRALILYC